MVFLCGRRSGGRSRAVRDQAGDRLEGVPAVRCHPQEMGESTVDLSVHADHEGHSSGPGERRLGTESVPKRPVGIDKDRKGQGFGGAELGGDIRCVLGRDPDHMAPEFVNFIKHSAEPATLERSARRERLGKEEDGDRSLSPEAGRSGAVGEFEIGSGITGSQHDGNLAVSLEGCHGFHNGD